MLIHTEHNIRLAISLYLAFPDWSWWKAGKLKPYIWGGGYSSPLILKLKCSGTWLVCRKSPARVCSTTAPLPGTVSVLWVHISTVFPISSLLPSPLDSGLGWEGPMQMQIAQKGGHPVDLSLSDCPYVHQARRDVKGSQYSPGTQLRAVYLGKEDKCAWDGPVKYIWDVTHAAAALKGLKGVF